MRDPGIEPGSVPWQGTILPLNQPRFRFHGDHVQMAIVMCTIVFNRNE